MFSLTVVLLWFFRLWNIKTGQTAYDMKTIGMSVSADTIIVERNFLCIIIGAIEEIGSMCKKESFAAQIKERRNCCSQNQNPKNEGNRKSSNFNL